MKFLKVNIFLTLLLLSFCSSLEVDRNSDLSEYFRSKHVVNNGHVRRQLLSSRIPDDRKRDIVEKYVLKPFNAQPNPVNPPTVKPWRAALSGKSTSTLILASQREISNRIRQGTFLGLDSKGQSAFEARGTLPMIKTKITFGNPLANVPHRVNFVNDGNPVVRKEGFAVSHLNGRVNHFESLNKHKVPVSPPVQPSGVSRNRNVGASKPAGTFRGKG